MTFHLSESYAMAGETARALDLLEWAVDHGFYPDQFFAKWCPFMIPLRGSPEFDRIVAKAARRVAEFSVDVPGGEAVTTSMRRFVAAHHGE
jgi:hypothetical protein